jgi:hypothetical protein
MKILKIIVLTLLLVFARNALAQELDATLQIRPRYEFRNGYKEPIPYGETPAQFVSSRTRLNLNFRQEQFMTKLSMQNVRVWGDVPTNTKSDVNGIQLYEAWVQYNFNEKWSARFGRQVISYDNQRVFGEVDWTQQAQSHDAVMVIFKGRKNHLDVAIAYNANTESELRIPYTVVNYKSMQYAWYHTELGRINMSLLFLNTGYENKLTPAVKELKIDYMQTFGTYWNTKGKSWDGDLWFYGQTGKNTTNTISAVDAALNFNYLLTHKFKAGFGYEFLSGKSQANTSTTIKSFNPIFGTNHGLNGNMDYFYVGNHKNSVGLQDAFLKLGYAVNKWQFALLPHVFNAANTVLDASGNEMNNYLGTEVDFTFGCSVHKFVNITGGYSQMFATDTMQRLKDGEVDHVNNWAWVMINVNPQIFSYKK